jgi:hypothetical protein
MSRKGETALAELQAAVREFLQREERAVDLPAPWAVIQTLKHDLATRSPASNVSVGDAEVEE